MSCLTAKQVQSESKIKMYVQERRSLTSKTKKLGQQSAFRKVWKILLLIYLKFVDSVVTKDVSKINDIFMLEPG